MNITQARKEFLTGRAIRLTLTCCNKDFGIFKKYFVYDLSEKLLSSGVDLKTMKNHLLEHFNKYVKNDIHEIGHISTEFGIVESDTKAQEKKGNYDHLFKKLTLEELTAKMPRMKHYIENRERLNFLRAKKKIGMHTLTENELTAIISLEAYCAGIESMFN